MTRAISLAPLVAAFLVLCAPRAASAQQMNFSYYTDAYFSGDGQTLYTIIDGYDNSTGCTHYGYENTGYVWGPSGNFQQGFSGLSSYMGVPLTGGNYSFSSEVVVNCSCFGSGLGAGGGWGTVPVDQIPSGETSSVNGWDGVATKFRGHLQGGTFSGRVVREQAGGNDTDNCWWPNSTHPPYGGVTGGSWNVDGSSSYGDDYLAWSQSDILYYRSAGRAPCQAETDQIMQINQPGSRWVKYTTNRLKNGIGTTNVWNERDGVAASINWP